MKNIIILGPQGSGKGEQTERLAPQFNLRAIATGDLFREIAQEKSERGRIVNEMINIKGKILPDDFTFKVLKEVLEEKTAKAGFIFDGYPRTFAQLEKFEAYLRQKGEKIDKVFYLKISPETSVKRLSSRLVCEKCQDVYNLITHPPKKVGVCDECGGKLVRRKDDEPQAISERLAAYSEQTEPMIAYFKKQKVLEEIDGEEPIEAVFAQIKKRWEKNP